MTVSHKSHAVFEKLCPWHYHESCIMKMRSCYIVIYLKLFMNQWHGGKWKSPQKQNLAMLYLVMPKVHTTFKVFKANVSSLSCTSTDPANFVSSHRTCLCCYADALVCDSHLCMCHHDIIFWLPKLMSSNSSSNMVMSNGQWNSKPEENKH